MKNKILRRIKGVSTPLYYYDLTLLDKTLQSVKESAGKYDFIVHYALKANGDKRLLNRIKAYNLGIDCVSGNEIYYAIESGFLPKDIVFAGVGKTDAEINYAIDCGIFCFNCESREELEVINGLAAAKNKRVRVALRVNPDIDPHTHKFISTGKASSKFGIASIELSQIIAKIGVLQYVDIVGLHFHIGSQITDMRVFDELCQKVNSIVEWFGKRCMLFEHINLGGGLGIDYENPDGMAISDFETYFSLFDKGIIRTKRQKLHFELGRSIVGQCGQLITKVLYNKMTDSGDHIVVVDAGMNDLMRPALYGAKHKIDNLSSQGPESEYTIVGPICESSDVFSTNIMLPQCRRGDLLIIKSTGAYGASMSSKYNMRKEANAVYSED